MNQEKKMITFARIDSSEKQGLRLRKNKIR